MNKLSENDPFTAQPFHDARWAFERYEALRNRLPRATRAGAVEHRANLGELAGQFDVFVFDSFGVLNVGETPIAGADQRIAQLRAAGKTVIVLTNAATSPTTSLPAKFAGLGFDFKAHEIISSREILASALTNRSHRGRWAIVAPPESQIGELGVDCELFGESIAAATGGGGIVLLSSQSINEAVYAKLKDMLTNHPQPLLVGNPDLVAPRPEGLSLEPGYYAHRLADELAIEPEFFGKPYANAFEAIVHRAGPNQAPGRIAMIGDTLHTDILGAAAAGFGTVLVTDHGIMKDMDASACIEQSGICPDYVIPAI